jgi:molybdopterin-guanine dinucleotide biosynthesis protein A
MAGIAAALPYCTNDRVLIIPCDMPFLPGNIVEKLSAGAGKDISIAASETKMQLVFLMHKKLQESIQHSLDNNQLRLMQWLSSHQPAIIHFTDDGAFTNFNHRENLDT